MLDKKLARIRELLEVKERTDTELAQLLGEQEKPRRGRPRTEKTEPDHMLQSE